MGFQAVFKNKTQTKNFFIELPPSPPGGGQPALPGRHVGLRGDGEPADQEGGVAAGGRRQAERAHHGHTLRQEGGRRITDRDGQVEDSHDERHQGGKSMALESNLGQHLARFLKLQKAFQAVESTHAPFTILHSSDFSSQHLGQKIIVLLNCNAGSRSLESRRRL